MSEETIGRVVEMLPEEYRHAKTIEDVLVVWKNLGGGEPATPDSPFAQRLWQVANVQGYITGARFVHEQMERKHAEMSEELESLRARVKKVPDLERDLNAAAVGLSEQRSQIQNLEKERTNLVKDREKLLAMHQRLLDRSVVHKVLGWAERKSGTLQHHLFYR